MLKYFLFFLQFVKKFTWEVDHGRASSRTEVSRYHVHVNLNCGQNFHILPRRLLARGGSGRFAQRLHVEPGDPPEVPGEGGAAERGFGAGESDWFVFAHCFFFFHTVLFKLCKKCTQFVWTLHFLMLMIKTAN